MRLLCEQKLRQKSKFLHPRYVNVGVILRFLFDDSVEIRLRLTVTIDGNHDAGLSGSCFFFELIMKLKVFNDHANFFRSARNFDEIKEYLSL